MNESFPSESNNEASLNDAAQEISDQTLKNPSHSEKSVPSPIETTFSNPENDIDPTISLQSNEAHIDPTYFKPEVSTSQPNPTSPNSDSTQTELDPNQKLYNNVLEKTISPLVSLDPSQNPIKPIEPKKVTKEVFLSYNLTPLGESINKVIAIAKSGFSNNVKEIGFANAGRIGHDVYLAALKIAIAKEVASEHPEYDETTYEKTVSEEFERVRKLGIQETRELLISGLEEISDNAKRISEEHYSNLYENKVFELGHDEEISKIQSKINDWPKASSNNQ